MFFDRKERKLHCMADPYPEVYLLTIEESMARLNETCRYQLPDEFLDVLPEEFAVIPALDSPTCSVLVKAGVSMTDALDAMFHDIKSDIGGPQKIIDCALANSLVAAQAARSVFANDDLFNAFVDGRRGGRDKPISMKRSTSGIPPNILFNEFGVCASERRDVLPPAQAGEVRFGYMFQADPDAYSRKHDFLTSRGFHHIVLPDQSVVAFAPDVGGRFANREALAHYLLEEMNADLSIEEWHVHIKFLSSKFRDAGISSDKIKIEHILDLVSQDLPKFLRTIEQINAVFPSSSVRGISQDQKLQVTAISEQIGAPITSGADLSYIVSFAMSLKPYLDLNSIKVPANQRTYAKMIEEAARLSSAFEIARIPQRFLAAPAAPSPGR